VDTQREGSSFEARMDSVAVIFETETQLVPAVETADREPKHTMTSSQWRETLFKNYVLFVTLALCIWCQCLLAGEKLSGIRVFGLNKLTNSILSGTVPISFEARNEIGTLRYAMLRVDGHIFPGDNATLSAPNLATPLKSRSRFEMDTCFLENG